MILPSLEFSQTKMCLRDTYLRHWSSPSLKFTLWHQTDQLHLSINECRHSDTPFIYSSVVSFPISRIISTCPRKPGKREFHGVCPNVNIHLLKEYKTSKYKNILKYHHFETPCHQFQGGFLARKRHDGERIVQGVPNISELWNVF